MEPAAPSPEIAGLTAHSGLVEPGFLFAALAGRSDDGRRHMQEAGARGAVAVLAEPGAQVPAGRCGWRIRLRAAVWPSWRRCCTGPSLRASPP